jgi:peptidyl-prolyl cis-trans isomerase SurA
MKQIKTLLSLMALALLSNNAVGAFILLDRIAVIVDETVIMQSEIDERIGTIRANLASNREIAIPPDDIIRQQVIERLISENLQLQVADRAGVRVSDAELNTALQSIAQQNQLSLIDFRVALEQDGISYNTMREQIRREMIISQVQQGVMGSRIEISEQELKNFLASEVGETITSDEYRLAHILIAIPDKANASEIQALRDEADQVLTRLSSGESFTTLAIEKSAGQNAINGGDLGWRKPVQLPTMFADIAQEMDVNEVRGPIRSGSGFHLVTLLDKRGARAEGQVAQTQVRHVLLQPSEIRTDEEARDLAMSLRQEVVDGRAFDEVAKLYSEDPGSALSGGDLGWNRADTFVPEFEQQMREGAINEVSEVFKTDHGYHFLEVTGRRVEDFSEQFRRNQAENYLRNQKFDEELENWMREIREQAFVDIRI